jgi:hydroxymethylpyrimidine/phosphomethylpyrimidine kinase
MVMEQIRCLFDDIKIHAVKIGMVSSIPLIEAVAQALGNVPCPPVVLDPVMISKSGYRLLKKDAQQALTDRLFPLAEVVTPNLHEARALAGKAIPDLESMRDAARRIVDMGVKKVVVKGGHLGGEDATDVVFDGNRFMELTHRRIPTRNTHGTGCTFSSAVAAGLAQEKDFFTAVESAKAYVTGAIENALPLGKGCGPTHHFWNLYAKAGVF